MTRLVYLEQMQLNDYDTTVVRVDQGEAESVVILEATIFYPQGGGQPFDTGSIESSSGKFLVESVRWRGEEVAHIGRFSEGTFETGAGVHCRVDAARRALHTRLHSAGHVVDMAVERLGYGWKPGKGYHFPDGPYVEYGGELSGEKEAVRLAIERVANEIVEEAAATRVTSMSRAELEKVVRFVPDYVSTDHPSRVVFYGEFGVPCGGTHVGNVSEVGSVSIRKLKGGAGALRVSYAIS